MTTPTLIAASPHPAPELDLDTRLVLLGIEMDARLNEAGIRFDINTAHLATDAMAAITGVVPLTPTLTPASTGNPYSKPLAALLHRARIHIETHGWHQGHLRDENGPADSAARCPIGAIRIEAAGNRHQADDACVLLLDAIQADFPDATSIPSWNDAQDGPQLPLRYLDRAAQLADTKGL